MIAYEDYQQEEIITKTEENSRGMDVIITFDDTTNPPSFGGRNTTNRVGGTFEYTGHRLIQTSSLFSTFVGQPEWGDRFNKALSQSNLQFTINTTRLKLFNASKQLSVTLVKE